MGLTPTPHNFSDKAIVEAYDVIDDISDIILHHNIVNGVPWPEALEGKNNYDAQILKDLNNLRKNTPKGKKIYISTTAQNIDRTGIAQYSEFRKPLPNWENKTFDDPEVIEAFTTWSLFLIDYFDPDYFAYGIEVNYNFESIDSPVFKQYKNYAGKVYSNLKEKHPDLPIFLTFTTSNANVDEEENLKMIKELLEYSDIIGVSTYPYFIPSNKQFYDYGNPEEIPKDWINSIRQLAPGKPFAITETGYTAEDISFTFGTFVKGTEKWQAAYVDKLLNNLNELDAEFVIWYFARDSDQAADAYKAAGVHEDTINMWKDDGLYDGDGNERPALDIWKKWLELPRR